MPVSLTPIFDTLRPILSNPDGSPDWPVVIGACALVLITVVAVPKITVRLIRKRTSRHQNPRTGAIERRMADRPADPLTSRVGNARETRTRLSTILQLTEQALNPTRPDEQRRQSLLTARDQIRELLEGTSDASDAPGAPSPARQMTGASASPDHPPSVALANMRILVADESAESRKTIAAWLGSAGATVVLANSSRAAVELTMQSLRSGQTHDVILMDLDQSRVDGLAAVATLRQLGFAGQIVATSSSILAAEHKRFFDAGCSTHLIKPLTRVQLLMVATALRSGGSTTEPTTKAEQLNDDVDIDPSSSSCPVVNDPDIQPLLTEFIGGLRQHADVLTAAFQDADLARIRIVAHQLAGSATDYGFEAITRQARAVEMALQSTVTDTDKMKTELETLTALCRKATAPRIIVPEDEN